MAEKGLLKKGKVLFSWTGKESVAYERGLAWYIMGGAVVAILIAYAILNEQS